MFTKIEELKAELAIVRAHEVDGTTHHGPWVGILKAKEFRGSRMAKEVDNFLWNMDNYFKATRIIDDAMKVSIVSMYFADVTLL